MFSKLQKYFMEKTNPSIPIDYLMLLILIFILINIILSVIAIIVIFISGPFWFMVSAIFFLSINISLCYYFFKAKLFFKRI
jgi:hypothetical protein